MILRKTVAMLALALSVAFAGTGWANSPKAGGTLNFAVVAGPPTYDLHGANTFAVIHYLAPHYSGLLTFDWANYPALEGDLAKDWSVSSDQLTYTFNLRPGVTFHDGSAMTSADVKASYDRLRNPPEGVVSVRQSQFADIDSIDTPDDLTVVFNMKRANSSMMMVFASPWNAIYSAEKLAENPTFPDKNVLGTGPFKFVEHVAGAKWVGEKYDNYFMEGRPYLDGFVANQIAGKALVNAVQGGQVQAEFRGVAPPQKKQLANAMGDKIKFLEGPRLTNWLFAINTTKPPFDDKRVRQALNLAIDRCQGLQLLSEITLVLPNMATVLWPDNAQALSAEELAKLPGYSCDIEANRAKAKQLLKEAGQENLSFTLTNRAIPHPYDALGIYVLDQWQRTGINASMDSLPTAPYAAARKSGNFEVIMDFAPEFADSAALNWGKYISRSKSPANFARYEDPELDSLFDTVKYSADATERANATKAFQERVLDEAYWIFLSYSTRIVPLDPAVNGWQFSPSHTLGQSLRDVWLEQ